MTSTQRLAQETLQSPYPLSEATIEAIVERRTDRLDRAYLAGEVTEAQYSKESAEIDAWAEQEYARYRQWRERHSNPYS